MSSLEPLCRAGYTFCFVVVGGVGSLFNQTWHSFCRQLIKHDQTCSDTFRHDQTWFESPDMVEEDRQTSDFEKMIPNLA
jgi:hypothetical protein